MADCTCIVCGNHFTAARVDAKYCSDDCVRAGRRNNYRKDITKNRAKKLADYYQNREKYNSLAKKRKSMALLDRGPLEYQKKCVYCGEVFVAKRSDTESCGKRDKQHRMKEKPSMKTAICPQCGVEFYKRTGDYNRDLKNGKIQCCSSECLKEYRGTHVNLTCDHCGKTFDRYKSYADKMNGYVFCSRKCSIENLDYRVSGESHYRYIDGSTQEKNYSRGPGWTAIRTKIRERDGYTCQTCGVHEYELGKALDVHHIIAFRNFDSADNANHPENLISLCPSCHHQEEIIAISSKLTVTANSILGDILQCQLQTL